MSKKKRILKYGFTGIVLLVLAGLCISLYSVSRISNKDLNFLSTLSNSSECKRIFSHRVIGSIGVRVETGDLIPENRPKIIESTLINRSIKPNERIGNVDLEIMMENQIKVLLTGTNIKVNENFEIEECLFNLN